MESKLHRVQRIGTSNFRLRFVMSGAEKDKRRRVHPPVHLNTSTLGRDVDSAEPGRLFCQVAVVLGRAIKKTNSAGDHDAFRRWHADRTTRRSCCIYILDHAAEAEPRDTWRGGIGRRRDRVVLSGTTGAATPAGQTGLSRHRLSFGNGDSAHDCDGLLPQRRDTS